jgi:hypothetical protein
MVVRTESKESIPSSRVLDAAPERTKPVSPQISPSLAAWRMAEPQSLRRVDILALQRSVGNRAVQRMLASRQADHFGQCDANGVSQGADSAVQRASSSVGSLCPIAFATPSSAPWELETAHAETPLHREEDVSAPQANSHLLQRQPKATTAPAPQPAAAQPAAPDQHYSVGGVSYTEKDWNVAVSQVAQLWTDTNGILGKQKTAVSRFCGKSAAGADKEPDLFESAFNAAVLAIIGIATDGLGLAIGFVAEKSTAKLISYLPKAIGKESVEAVTKKALDAAIDKGKEKAKEAAKKKVEAAAVVSTPDGSRKLATPLASLEVALEDSIDKGGSEEKNQTLQTLLASENTAPPEAKWVAAAALYEGLKATIEQADEVQWNATSDAWLNMQQASGRGTNAEVDIGRVLIDLSKSYPDEAAHVDAAYIAGQGVNEITLEPYNQRALNQIVMSKMIVMDSGRMGGGWVDCQWKILIGADNTIVDVKGTNRYGELWLAAHGVGKKDLDFGDADFKWANVQGGAQKVWDTIKGGTTKFKEASMTSGPGPW